ncbi:hypothetical protein NBRC116494_20340 [Aurantivibrio plasticivorans]
MKRLSTFALVVLCIGVAGCTSMRVATDYDIAYSFVGKKTFALVSPNEHAMESDDLIKARIERAIVRELEAKGMQSVAEGEADLIVSYLSTSEREKDIRTYRNYNDYYGYRTCYRCYDPRWSVFNTTTEVRTVEYIEGVLMIDFIDPETQVLKWRGQTKARFTPREVSRMSPQEKTELVNEAVAIVLSEFPPSGDS